MGFEVKKDCGEKGFAEEKRFVENLLLDEAAGAAADRVVFRAEGVLRAEAEDAALRGDFAALRGFVEEATFAAFAGFAAFAIFALFAFFAAGLRPGFDAALADEDDAVEGAAAGRIAGDRASAGRMADTAAGAGDRTTDVVEPPKPGVAAAGPAEGFALWGAPAEEAPAFCGDGNLVSDMVFPLTYPRFAPIANQPGRMKVWHGFFHRATAGEREGHPTHAIHRIRPFSCISPYAEGVSGEQNRAKTLVHCTRKAFTMGDQGRQGFFALQQRNIPWTGWSNALIMERYCPRLVARVGWPFPGPRSRRLSGVFR